MVYKNKDNNRSTSQSTGPVHPITHYFVFIYLFTAGISDSVARCKFSPTTTTTAANDYYTNAPCPRGHCVD
jgi:hypothetical protein